MARDIRAGLKQSEIWVHDLIIAGSLAGVQGTFTGSLSAVSLGVPTVSIGSPESLGDIAIQAGASGVSTGSSGWVAFNKTWSTAPRVFTTATLGSAFVMVGSVGTGSFWVLHATPTGTFSWFAIGAR